MIESLVRGVGWSPTFPPSSDGLLTMLYIVATPIGNLDDISLRAIKVLQQVDKIAAEDTRHSQQLLKHLKINKPLIALHDHNEQTQSKKLIEDLKAGESIAIISDAGTPLISDPGFRLVKLAHENNIRVVPIPGACAVITAICASGLPTDRFIFEGFLPAKITARKSHLTTLKSEERTLVFYEAPHRLLDTLKDLGEVFGVTRHAVLARELTKTFETIKCGDIQYLFNFVANDTNQQKGEIVLVVAGVEKDTKDLAMEISSEAKIILAVLLEELPLKQAASLTAKITGERKRSLYNYVLTL